MMVVGYLELLVYFQFQKELFIAESVILDLPKYLMMN